MQEQFQIQYWVEQVALFNDQEAYEKLFLHFNEGLYRLAFSFVKSSDIAEEIISDTFINLWRNRSRLPEIDNLKVYLYVSVKNLSVKYLTRTRKESAFSLEDMHLDMLPCHTATPEDMMISAEMLRVLDEAVNNLPARCKLIFKMVREDGLKYKDISRLLNISVKTIDAQMAIASKRIAESLHILLKK